MIRFLLLLLSALPAFAGTPAEVTYYEIPLAPADMTVDRVASLRNIILPTEAAAADLVVWTSAASWYDANYYGPLLTVPSNPAKPAKMWSIRPSSPNPISRYLRVALDSEGKVRRYSIRPAAGGSPGANPPETATVGGTLTPDSLLMQGIIGQNALNFLAEWGGWFEAGIPLLEWTDITPDEARSVNFGGTGFVQLPLATPGVDPYHASTWPQAFLPCFHPVTGKVAFFKIDDFIRLVPKKAIGGSVVAAPGQTWSATDAQIGSLARMLVAFSASATDAEVGQQINRAARATK